MHLINWSVCVCCKSRQFHIKFSLQRLNGISLWNMIISLWNLYLYGIWIISEWNMNYITWEYLNNCTFYNKIVCTILFSSRWWVYWYELFSVLSTLQKWQKVDKTPSLYNKGIFTNFGYFFIIWDIDIIKMYSWFWVKWYN